MFFSFAMGFYLLVDVSGKVIEACGIIEQASLRAMARMKGRSRH